MIHYWPSYIRPWPWRILFALGELVMHYGIFLPVKLGGSWLAQWVTDKAGPFAPGRGHTEVRRIGGERLYFRDGRRVL